VIEAGGGAIVVAVWAWPLAMGMGESMAHSCVNVKKTFFFVNDEVAK